MPDHVVLGKYRYSPSSKSLYLNKQFISLEPKFTEVLDYLVMHRDRYITIAELHENVWKDRIVSDAAIRRVISKLRAILEEEPSKPEVLVSATKRGYKINCSVYQPENQVITNLGIPKIVLVKRHLLLIISIFFLLLLSTLLVVSGTDGKGKTLEKSEVKAELSLIPFDQLPNNSRFLDISPNRKLILFQTITKPRRVKLSIKNIETNQTVTLENSHQIDKVVGDASFINENRLFISRIASNEIGRLEVWELDESHQLTAQKVIVNNAFASDSLFVDKKNGTLFASFKTKKTAFKNQKFTYHRIKLDVGNFANIEQLTQSNDLENYDFGGALSPNNKLIAYFRLPELNYEREIQVMDLESRQIIKRFPWDSKPNTLQWLSNEELVVQDFKGLKKVSLKTNATTPLLISGDIHFNKFTNMAKLDEQLLVSTAAGTSKSYLSVQLLNNQVKVNEINRSVKSLNLYDRAYQMSQQFEILKKQNQYLLQRVDIETGYEEILLSHQAPIKVFAEATTGELILRVGERFALFHPRYKQLNYLNTEQETVEDAIFDTDNFHILLGLKVDGNWGIYRYNPETKSRVLFISGYRSIRIAENGFLVKNELGDLFSLSPNLNTPKKLKVRLATLFLQSWYVKENKLYWIDSYNGWVFKTMNLLTHEINTVEIPQDYYGQFFSFDPISERFIFHKKEDFESNIWSVNID